MQRVILIHGNGGSSGKDNWFPWLQDKLTSLGVPCEAPDFPDPVTAKASIWLPYLKNTLKADENTILVGHSSGAVAALRYAESNKLYGTILVGTYYTDLGYDDEKESGYFDTPWQWGAIKDNQNWIDIFASPDDPYISIDEPRYMRDQLGADYHELQNQGHFGGTEDRVKLKFPEILEVIKQRVGTNKV